MARFRSGLSVLLLAVTVVAGQGFAQEKKDWTAKWIWNSGEANPTNYFLMLRKTFHIESRPDSAVLHITSANRYKLFINGKYIGGKHLLE